MGTRQWCKEKYRSGYVEREVTEILCGNEISEKRSGMGIWKCPSLDISEKRSGIQQLLLYTGGVPCGSAGKESAHNAGDLGSIPGLERSPGEGKGYPLQYSGLENSMDCIDHGVAKSRTRPSDFHFTDFQE